VGWLRAPAVLAAAIGAVAWAIAAVLPIPPDGSIDVLLWLRAQLTDTTPADDPPVAVVAIDEETYRRPPFDELPMVLWAPQLGKVLTAVIDGGARVVGFDLVNPTSVERLFPGYERELLLALRHGGAQGRVVLGHVQRDDQSITPFAGYVLAAGGGRNLRPLNLAPDGDGVIRRVPLRFSGERGAVPSMASELARRSHDIATTADSVLLNVPRDYPRAIPTFSFADLHACDDPAFFARHFADRVVLLGVVLDVEDRVLAANRLIADADAPPAARCRLAALAPQPSHAPRATIPGVHVHAIAVTNLIRGDGLRRPPASAGAALEFGTGVLVALAGLGGGLAAAAASGGMLVALITGAAVAAFAHNLLLPLVPAATIAASSLGLTALWRYAVVDRARRRIRRAFAYYLPEPVVDQLAQQGRLPERGGEIRPVTVLFIDIAGFTTMAEHHDPTLLVDEVNRYFDAVSRVITGAHKGYVDRFLGDAVLAMFGAPVDDPDHAAQAVAAALRIQAVLRDGDFRIAGHPVRARIGINTGRALIGNIGAARHFSYTAMGDDVNLAARIEAANKEHGTAILVSAATMRGCAGAFAFREVGSVRLRGRVEPVTLFEPLGAAGSDGGVACARAGEVVP
jgi:class 3 adenylate cyclase